MVKKKVLIVDDHPVVRRGLAQLFEGTIDFAVVGEAEHGFEALRMTEELAPDLLIADLMMEGMSGLDVIRQMNQFHPDVAILVVSMHDEALYAERALKAGAKGYVMKRKAPDEIILAARQVLTGRIYVSEQVGKQLDQQRFDASGPSATPSPLMAGLSDRELEVFRLLGQGYAPRHIAEHLHLSVSTVEVYRQRLKEKLHVADSAELTRFAVSWWKEQPTF